MRAEYSFQKASPHFIHPSIVSCAVAIARRRCELDLRGLSHSRPSRPLARPGRIEVSISFVSPWGGGAAAAGGYPREATGRESYLGIAAAAAAAASLHQVGGRQAREEQVSRWHASWPTKLLLWLSGEAGPRGYQPGQSRLSANMACWAWRSAIERVLGGGRGMECPLLHASVLQHAHAACSPAAKTRRARLEDMHSTSVARTDMHHGARYVSWDGAGFRDNKDPPSCCPRLFSIVSEKKQFHVLWRHLKGYNRIPNDTRSRGMLRAPHMVFTGTAVRSNRHQPGWKGSRNGV